MVNRCAARAQGMRKLIVDLLDLTRIESGQKRREIARLNLREVVTASVDAVAIDARARDIEIHVDCPESLVIDADRGELEIILNNLVSNAVKYNRDGGGVEIRLAADQDRLSIEVQDSGIGMKPEDAKRLFNDFVRIKNAQTANILGSGLGLSIVKKIASLYGGEVGVESEEGRGSTFRVTLQRHLPTTPLTSSERAYPVASI
ncbi:MAG: sensor histidine kinase, partial [Phycisphaerales bacterium JB038]